MTDSKDRRKERKKRALDNIFIYYMHQSMDGLTSFPYLVHTWSYKICLRAMTFFAQTTKSTSHVKKHAEKHGQFSRIRLDPCSGALKWVSHTEARGRSNGCTRGRKRQKKSITSQKGKIIGRTVFIMFQKSRVQRLVNESLPGKST